MLYWQRGETCTLLKVAVHWLRGEQEEARKETLERRRVVEESGGENAIRDRNPNLKACEYELRLLLSEAALFRCAMYLFRAHETDDLMP